MVKKKDITGSLIPDTVVAFDAGGSYEPAEEEEITPVKIVEFYDPDFGPKPDDGLLSIYEGPRYGGKTLKELKEMCKDRDLAVSGTKKTLIDRLVEENRRIKEEIDFKEELKKKKELEKAQAEKEVVDDTIARKKKTVQFRLRKAQKLRLKKLEDLISAQKAFDEIEAAVNDLKVTIKSLDSLF